MTDDKVYSNTIIEETPFPNEEEQVVTTSDKTGSNTYTNKTTQPVSFPTKRIAVEVIGTALNTKSLKILQKFEFTKHGAIQVGEYQNGVSGEIKISPDGIVAKNQSGLTTFALDGDTGDAVFKGTIQSGAVVTETLAVGPDGDIYIDGANKRMIWYNGGIPAIVIGDI